MATKYKRKAREWRLCERCGAATKGTAKKRYCGNLCRALASRQRHRDRMSHQIEKGK